MYQAATKGCCGRRPAGLCRCGKRVARTVRRVMERGDNHGRPKRRPTRAVGEHVEPRHLTARENRTIELDNVTKRSGKSAQGTARKVPVGAKASRCPQRLHCSGAFTVGGIPVEGHIPAHRRRSMTSTRESFAGGGLNRCRGTRRPGRTLNSMAQRLAPGAWSDVHRWTAQSGRTRCAVCSRLPRWRRRRSTAFVIAYGGLATTWKGRLGRRRSAASARTTVTRRPKRCSRWRARPSCSSTARTRCPSMTNGLVIAPVPAPMSRTSAAWGSDASATRC